VRVESLIAGVCVRVAARTPAFTPSTTTPGVLNEQVLTKEMLKIKTRKDQKKRAIHHDFWVRVEDRGAFETALGGGDTIFPKPADAEAGVPLEFELQVSRFVSPLGMLHITPPLQMTKN
jgi:hypothetical protein